MPTHARVGILNYEELENSICLLQVLQDGLGL